ncbi:MAG: sodium-dependent bicarbonate transport family permease [Halothermotrichaceae bacterium]
MISLEVALSNIMSPAIMFFILGVIATLIKSDLEIPNSMGTALTMFILISIGLKAGIAVSKTGILGVIVPVISSITVGIIITLAVYFIMLKLGFDSANAGSIGGHYGACSSVTLTTVIVFLGRMGASFEEFVPALYPFMDTAALITGIALGHAGLKKKSTDDEYSIINIIRESLTSKSTVLIIGGLLIGLLAGTKGTKDLMPFYDNAFQGIFTIFMLDIGILAGSRISELKNVKPITFIIALLMPPIQGIMAILISTFIGLSSGGATVFAALAAGASYISAPAVMRSTFPDANPSLALGMSLGIIFPFNIMLGIPLYYQFALMVS